MAGEEAGYLLAQNPVDWNQVAINATYKHFEDAGVPRDAVDLLLNSPYRDAALRLGLTGDETAFQTAVGFISFSQGTRTTGGGGGSGATDAQRAAAAAAEFRNLAGQFGVMDSQDWDALGAEAARNNWSVAMIKDAVAKLITADSLNSANFVKDIYNKAQAAGSQYFVRLGAEEVLNYARQIAADDMSEESMLGVIKDRAKAQFSWLSDVIDSGKSLQEYFKPQQQEIARLLEVSPDAINFMDDPKWQKVVQRPPDETDNSVRSMSLYETQKYVRGLQEWKATGNARTEAANMVGALAQVMGGL